jgi:tetratricopeptide (TPR) repeat protein
MERQLRQLLGGQGGGGPPQDRAQDLMYQAFESSDPEEQVRLAEAALDLWPDCADAYFLLAGYAPTRKSALELYEKAVAAGERALGPRAFREDAGHFWGILETRPYMRARLGLAETLWTCGRRDEAVGHLRDMLRLNPNDNQGLRYTLAAWLLAMDRDDDLAQLLEQYQEGSATWLYTSALFAFRRHGDSPEAQTLLKHARKANKHVPGYLVGARPVPPESPPYYSPGDDTEAIMYAQFNMSGWRATPGAIDWLRAGEKTHGRKCSRAPAAQGPTPAALDELRQLPQVFDVWQADCRQAPVWVESRGGMARPWLTLVISSSDGLVLGHEMAEDRPEANALWDVLAAAMARPLAGDPHRPSQVQLRPGPVADFLRAPLEDLGVACAATEDLEQFEDAFGSLAEHLTEDREPGLLDVEGVTPEQAGRVFEAAAEFYERAPWRDLGYEETIRVECPALAGGPWFGVVYGQSGMTYGLSLYDDLASLRALQTGAGSDEENARATVATTVNYGEAWDVPVGDLEAAERFGWRVAGPNAYPHMFRKERGMNVHPPSPEGLTLIEACLRAVPAFVHEHAGDPRAVAERTVPAAGGQVTLRLSWVEDDEA